MKAEQQDSFLTDILTRHFYSDSCNVPYLLTTEAYLTIMEFDFEKISEWPSLSHIDSSKDKQGERISELIRCTQCKESLHDSITLHCLHFLCKACFERKIGEQKDESCTNTSEISINCPACFYCTFFKKPEKLQTYLETQIRVPQVMKTLLDFKF